MPGGRNAIPGSYYEGKLTFWQKVIGTIVTGILLLIVIIFVRSV